MTATVIAQASSVMSKMVRGGVETVYTIDIAIERVGDRHKVSVMRRQYAGPDNPENREAVLVTASAANWAEALKLANERMDGWHHDLYRSAAYLESLCAVEEQAWAGSGGDASG